MKQRQKRQKDAEKNAVKTKENRQRTDFEKRQRRVQQPISWRNSEGIYHMHDESLVPKENMTGLYEGKSISSEKRTKEVFRAENSYGNIAIGANQKKEAVVAVSQKREHNSTNTEGKLKELQIERTKRKVTSKGDFLTNPGGEKDGAAAYRVGTNMKEQKVFPQIKKIAQSQGNIMFEKRMPFLSLDRDKEERRELREQIREHREKNENAKAEKLEKEKESLENIIQQKEEHERVMQRKIKLAWRKMQSITNMDIEQTRNRKKNIDKIDNIDEDDDEEKNEESKEL